MKLLRWILGRIRRLSLLESAVLEHVAAALPHEEGKILRRQIQLSHLERQWGNKVVFFSFHMQSLPPKIKWLAGSSRTAVATVRAMGRASRFTTTATIFATDGRLAEINFDPIPWSGAELYDMECHVYPRPFESADSPDSA